VDIAALEWTAAHEDLYQRIRRGDAVPIQVPGSGKEIVVQQRCTYGLRLWLDVRETDGILVRDGVLMPDRELRDTIRLWLPVAERNQKMSNDTEGVTSDDLSGIPKLPPMGRDEALAAVRAVARQHALVQQCACGACHALLPDGQAHDYGARCARCQEAGCDPILGVAYCRERRDPNADLD
jgi:hypothetical protein